MTPSKHREKTAPIRSRPMGRRPNQRVQPTPLAASEIGAILSAGFCSTVISVYGCGTADAQAVGRQSIAIYPAKP